MYFISQFSHVPPDVGFADKVLFLPVVALLTLLAVLAGPMGFAKSTSSLGAKMTKNREKTG